VKPSVRSDEPYPWLPEVAPSAVDDHVPRGRRRSARTKAAWLSALEWGMLAVGALVVALLIKTFLFQAFYIPSDSMLPTLERNDRVLVNKLSYRLHGVHRGDVIVFEAPPGVDPEVKDLVKRVIGLPGETIAARADGRVYIDGEPLDEPWLPAGTKTKPGFAPIKVPPDSYYVLGDFRENSRDSRYFPSHFVRKDDIVGF
jgi:signal peptidase I